MSAIHQPMLGAGQQYGRAGAIFGGGHLLVPEGEEVDFDRTPRHSTFPYDVQQTGFEGNSAYSDGQSQATGQHTYPLMDTDSNMPQSSAALDFQSYTMGLGEMGIVPPSLQRVPSFEDIAFSEYLVGDPEA